LSEAIRATLCDSFLHGFDWRQGSSFLMRFIARAGRQFGRKRYRADIKTEPAGSGTD
jgi:hypothetical protein